MQYSIECGLFDFERGLFFLIFLRLIMGLFILLAFNVLANTSVNAINSKLPIKAADCLIVDGDGNILMIDEVISGKYSIPGGSIIGDETPQMGATREVFEETGLHVDIGDMIARTYNSAIFACTLKTPTPYFIDENSRRVLMAWSAPHFGKEVTRVLLLPNTPAVRSHYRFPEHKWMFPQWVPLVTPSDFVFSPGEPKDLTPFYRSQLSALQSFHDYRAGSRSFTRFTNAIVAAGSLITPLFFLLSLVFIRAYHGHRATLIYGAGLFAVAVFTLLMTTIIEVPRPYFIDPVFGEHDTLGYTLPGSMVALTTFMFSWLLVSWEKEKHSRGRRGLALLGVVSVLLVSGKVLIQGEHYPSDVLVGFSIGLGASFALRQLRDWRFANRTRVLTSARFWLLSFVFAAVLGLWIHKPHIIYLSAMCLGTYCSLLCLKIYPIYVSAVRRHAKATFFVIASVGVLVLILMDNIMTAKYAVNEVIVALNCATGWAIAVWILVVTPRVFRQVMR